MLSKPKQTYPTFELLTSDEWDDIRSSIKEEIRLLNKFEMNEFPNPLVNALVTVFEEDIKNKLREKGFSTELINDLNELSYIVNRGDYLQCPDEVLKVSADKTRTYIDDDVLSAVRSTLIIDTFKDDIKNLILTDKGHYEIFLRSMLLFVEMFRAGSMRHIMGGIRHDAIKEQFKMNAMEPRKKKTKVKTEELIQKKAEEFIANNKNITLIDLTRKIVKWFGDKKGYSESTLKNLLRPVWKDRQIKSDIR